MDVAGAAGEIAKLKGAITRLENEDKQICTLISFVCEALCDIDPSLREKLLQRVDDRLQQDFGYGPGMEHRARTLFYGLRTLQTRLEE
jgi:hypothetical protein